MSDGKKYYCFCGSNCKYETMTKEQILAAIAQAVETGSVGDVDTGFITKVKEQNGGSGVSVWVGTRAQYNAIENRVQNCLYIITDDTTGDDILKACKNATDVAAEANAAAAEARGLAENAHGIAAELWDRENKSACINFTDKITFSWKVGAGGANLTELEATPLRFKYDPRTGLVHFVVNMFYRGKMAKGEAIEFLTYGNPYPPIFADNEVTFPICPRGNRFSAEYVETQELPTVVIYAEEAFDTQGMGGSMTFSGWYFAETYNVEE